MGHEWAVAGLFFFLSNSSSSFFVFFLVLSVTKGIRFQSFSILRNVNNKVQVGLGPGFNGIVKNHLMKLEKKKQRKKL